MTLGQMWSIMRGRRTNFRCLNASWTYYPDGDPIGNDKERLREYFKHHPGHITFPPDGHPYTQPCEGMPWLQTLILWVGCIGLVVLTLPAITVIVVGVVGSLMGLR